MSTETNKNYFDSKASPERGHRLNRETIRRNLAILALGVGVFLGGNAVINENIHGYGDNPEQFGDKNENATSVELEEKALLRKTPDVINVDGGNAIKTIDKDTIVKLNDGTYMHSDENGRWFYLTDEELAASGIEIGGEGAWVNDQLANLEEESPDK